jgi:AcrR family transcriptional regulator
VPALRTRPRADQRALLLDTARRRLEQDGPEALQARSLTAEVGASTQAIYTLFGGMPGLFEAIVAEGFREFTAHIEAVPTGDDPVADFFAQGWAFAEWALDHPQLYRLMFGLTGGRLRLHSGLEMTLSGPLANFPEGRAAADVMVRSLDRVLAAGRIRPTPTRLVAGQFLSATHGYVLLQIGGAFGDDGDEAQVIAALAVNLMVGLGDRRQRAERSLRRAFATRAG